MSEVFGKNPITSSEFPVVIFDAGGSLLHFNPPLEDYLIGLLKSEGESRSLEDIGSAMVRTLKIRNAEAERNENFEESRNDRLQNLLRELGFEEAAQKRILQKDQVWFMPHVKVVVAQSTFDFLAHLKERSYRLAIVSNWDKSLFDLLRLQDLMDFFEVVITADELGIRKPRREIFEAAIEELDLPAENIIHLGSSYATDVVGARRVGMKPCLYDPAWREMAALGAEDISKKVVSLEALRQNRRLEGVKVFTQLSEMQSFFL